MLLLLVSTNVFAFSLFGPKNYDECVLENMKGVSSDTAASLVALSCREMYKEKVVDNSQINQWILIQKDNEKNTYYFKSSIPKYGEVVTVKEMEDYNGLQNFQFYSQIKRIEIDCLNFTFRVLNMEWYSDHMGSGASVGYSIFDDKASKIQKNGTLYQRYCTN